MLTFTDFWAAYPKRLGANPKSAAEKKFKALVKSGIDPERLINSAKSYSDECKELNQINTPYIAHARTWLNQERYNDYAPDPGSAERNAKIDTDMRRRGYIWDGQKWVKIDFSQILNAG